MTRQNSTPHRKFSFAAPRRAASLGLLLGAGLLLAAGPASAQLDGRGAPAGHYANAAPVAQSDAVYSAAHVELLMTQALASQITVGRTRIEFDNRDLTLRFPADAESPVVEGLHYNQLNGRFAAEITATLANGRGKLRTPVSGRAHGMIEVPVLNRRVGPTEAISPDFITWIEVRSDQTGTDIAASESQLLGQTARRAVLANQPVRLRDLQMPRIIAKGALITITLSTPTLSLTAQGKALQDGGKGDVIRVVNTQSNRIVEATVIGTNLVAVAKPGVVAY